MTPFANPWRFREHPFIAMIRRVVRRSSLLLRAEVKFVDAVQMVVVETVATLVEEVQVVALAKQGTQ